MCHIASPLSPVIDAVAVAVVAGRLGHLGRGVPPGAAGAAAMGRLLNEAAVTTVHDAALLIATMLIVILLVAILLVATLLVAALLVAVAGLGLDIVVTRAATGTLVIVGHGGGLGAVALAVTGELSRKSVLGKSVGVVNGLSLAFATKAAEQASSAALGAVARGIVVVRARAEALLLAVVADEEDLGKNGEAEEETKRVSMARRGKLSNATYMATMATAKQAVCRRHAVRKLGSAVKPLEP